MHSKRCRIEEKKTEQKNIPIVKTPPVSAKDVLIPISNHLVRFTSLRDTVQLFRASVIFSNLSQSSRVWGALFDQHFGRSYFFTDFKLQYKAAHLLEIAQNSGWWLQYARFQQLRVYLEAHHKDQTKWTFYYFAKVSNHITDLPLSSVGYGLEALQAKDLRAEAHLVNYFIVSDNRDNYNASDLTRFLTLTDDPENDSIQRQQHRCIVRCALAMHATYTGDRDQLKIKQMTHLLNLANQLMPNLFLNFLLDVLQALRLLSNDEVGLIRMEILNQEPPNSLEILMHSTIYLAMQNDQTVLTSVNNWLQELAQTNPTASFHYAKKVLSQTHQHLLTKQYLIRALESGEIRALIEFHTLFKEHSGVIRKEEFDHYLKMMARRCDHVALNLITKDKKWEKDIEKIWFVLNYISKTNDKCKLKDALLKMGEKIEKAGLFVRCALTFIHGFSNARSAAEIQFHFAIAGHPAIFTTFLAHGKKLGFCTEKHVQLVTELQSQHNKGKSNHQASKQYRNK